VTSSQKSLAGILVVVMLWLCFSFWIHQSILPFDVQNTDVGTYLFQAQTFANGEVYRQTPEPREFFQQWQAVVRDKSYSYYAPVHGLLLAIPIVLNLNPWLFPWLLSAATLLLVYSWVKSFIDEKTALLTGLLTALSPYFSANAPSLLSHSTTLFLTVLFLIHANAWFERGDKKSAFLTGIFLALVFACRSANAAALGIIWIPYVFYLRRDKIRSEGPSWVSFGLGASLITLPLLIYYRLLAGFWTLDLFKIYWPRNKFGFGKDLGRGELGHFFQTYADHDWNGFFQNLKYSFTSLATWWSGNLWVSILFLTVLPWVFIRAKSNSKLCKLVPVMIAWFLVHIVLYALYFTQSTPPTGPRYLFETIVVPAIFSSIILIELWTFKMGRIIAALLIAAFLYSSTMKKYDFYDLNARALPMQQRLQDTVLKNAEAPALVLIRSFWIGHPFPIFLNDPKMKNPILFACDRGMEDRNLMLHYPNRNAYVLAVNPSSKPAQMELVPIYRAKGEQWLTEPGEIEAPFYIGNKFSKPLKLKDDEFRKLFHPSLEEIIPQ
jgi:hypothetical protein